MLVFNLDRGAINRRGRERPFMDDSFDPYSTSVFKITSVVLHNPHHRVGFDDDSADFLRQAGFAEPKASEKEPGISADAPADPFCFMAECANVPKSRSRDFRILRFDGKIVAEVETGQTIYIHEGSPVHGIPMEIAGTDSQHHNWTIFCEQPGPDLRAEYDAVRRHPGFRVRRLIQPAPSPLSYVEEMPVSEDWNSLRNESPVPEPRKRHRGRPRTYG